MEPYILIEPIQFGDLQEKKANAIIWTVSPLMRGAQSAIAQCALIWEDSNGNTWQVHVFDVEIDQETLNNWGSDDTVIDDAVLAYSPLFIRRNP
jgi:hypothetical protein